MCGLRSDKLPFTSYQGDTTPSVPSVRCPVGPPFLSKDWTGSTIDFPYTLEIFLFDYGCRGIDYVNQISRIK